MFRYKLGCSQHKIYLMGTDNLLHIKISRTYKDLIFARFYYILTLIGQAHIGWTQIPANPAWLCHCLRPCKPSCQVIMLCNIEYMLQHLQMQKDKSFSLCLGQLQYAKTFTEETMETENSHCRYCQSFYSSLQEYY